MGGRGLGSSPQCPPGPREPTAPSCLPCHAWSALATAAPCHPSTYHSLLVPGVKAKKPIQTKFRMPLLNWVALKPNQITGTVFTELNDEKVLQVSVAPHTAVWVPEEKGTCLDHVGHEAWSSRQGRALSASSRQCLLTPPKAFPLSLQAGTSLPQVWPLSSVQAPLPPPSHRGAVLWPPKATSTFPKGMCSLATRTLLFPLPGMPFLFPFLPLASSVLPSAVMAWVLLLLLLNDPCASPVSPIRACGQAG